LGTAAGAVVAGRVELGFGGSHISLRLVVGETYAQFAGELNRL